MRIDLEGLPPTAHEIAEHRRPFGRSGSHPPYLPLPGLDLARSLRLAALEGATDYERVQDVPHDLDLGWAQTPITQAYVEKVRALQRPLIVQEVQVLLAACPGLSVFAHRPPVSGAGVSKGGCSIA